MMATGRRWVGGFVVGAAFVLGSALATPTARADDADLKSAFDDYASGKYDDALKKLTDYVAKNPGDDEVYRVLRTVDETVKLRALAAGGDHERLMRYLLDKARPVVEAHKRDPEAIKALVEAALSGEIDVRRRADLDLATHNGDYAVPYLLPALGDADAEKVVNAMFALQAIGSEAVLPLDQVLMSSGDARLRGFSAAVLGQIGDSRALPALRRAVEKDADEGVKAKAAKAIVQIRPDAASMSAADSFVRLGERLFANDPSLLSEPDQVFNMWKWEGDALARYEMPVSIFNAALAQQNATDALALAPEHRGARSLLVRTTLSQMIAARSMGDKAPEGLKDSWNVALSQGFEAASAALADALTLKSWDVAVECCRLCAANYGKQDLHGHPLGLALAAPERRVQYAAAIAALRMSPAGAFDNSNQVPALAAQAASEQAMRQVFVIDDHDDARARLSQDLREAGYIVAADKDGYRGVARLKSAATVDVVVVRADLDAANQIPMDKWKSSLAVLDELMSDLRTKNMRVVVVVDSAAKKEFLTTKYGEKIAGYIDEPLNAPGYLPTVQAAIEKGDLNAERAAAQKVAAEAADAFASTNLCCSAWDVKVAIEPLATNVKEGANDEIKMNAVRALGNLKAGGCPALAEVLKSADAKEELKVAAATAIGNVLSRIASSPEEIDALVAAANAGGAVGSAAMQALGKVSGLSPEVSRSLFMGHRPEGGKKGE
jgi:CheY-like chemotaxis protein